MPDPMTDSSAVPVAASPASSDMGGSASLPSRTFSAPSQTVVPPPSDQSTGVSPSATQISSLGSPSGMGGTPRQLNAPPQTAITPPPALSPEHQLGSAMQQTAGAVNHVANSIGGSDTTNPGSIWRTILSAALVGAAAGAGHGWKGAGEGMKAEVAMQQRQQAEKQQQIENKRQADADEQRKAQQQWENKMKEKQEGRADAEEDRRKQLFLPQLALENHESLRTGILLQDADHASKKKAEAEDQARNDTYVQNGIQPVTKLISGKDTQLKDIPGPDMLTMEHAPGFSTLKWVITGTKDVDNPDGTKSSVNLYSAYEPDAKVKLSAPTLAQWKNDGLFKTNPNLEKVLTEGKELDVADFSRLNTTAKRVNNDNLEADQKFLAVEKLRQDIALDKEKVELERKQIKAAGAAVANEQRRQKLDTIKSYEGIVDHQAELLNKQATEETDPTKRTEIYNKIGSLYLGLKSRYDEIYPPTGKVQTGPPAGGGTLPPPPDTSLAAGLMETVQGYVPEPARPFLKKYIEGARDMNEANNRLTQDNLALPAGKKYTEQELKTFRGAIRSYFDNLPKVTARTEKENDTAKLEAIRTKYPGITVTEKDLPNYDKNGNKFYTPSFAN